MPMKARDAGMENGGTGECETASGSSQVPRPSRIDHSRIARYLPTTRRGRAIARKEPDRCLAADGACEDARSRSIMLWFHAEGQRVRPVGHARRPMERAGPGERISPPDPKKHCWGRGC